MTVITTMAPAAGSNSKKALDGWLDKCRFYGEAAGAGDTSKVGWFMDLAERAKNGDVVKDNVPDGWDVFVKSRIDKAAALRRVPKEDKGKGRGVRISEAKRIVHVATLPNCDGLGVLNRAMRIIRDTLSLKGETDDLLLRVARAQSRRPDSAFTNAEIEHVLKPSDDGQEEKSEADMLEPVAKRLEGIAKKYSWAPHTRSAYSSINARIVELGGTTRQANAAANAAAKAANKGKRKKK